MNTISSLLDPAQPAAWLLGSTAIAIAASNLAWLIARRSQRARATGGQIAAWLAVALFSVLPPFMAWRAGALSPYYLGLSGLDWIPALMTGLPVIALIIAVLLAGWLAYRRTLPRPMGVADHDRRSTLAILAAPLNAVLRQWHWTFYRAAAIAWIVTSAPAGHPLMQAWRIDLPADALYWGSWLGLLFIAAEWALNPFARSALRRAHAQETALRQVALAIATTALFALTRNLWLCLICHIAIETLIAGWLALPAGMTAGSVDPGID